MEYEPTTINDKFSSNDFSLIFKNLKLKKIKKICLKSINFQEE